MVGPLATGPAVVAATETGVAGGRREEVVVLTVRSDGNGPVQALSAIVLVNCCSLEILQTDDARDRGTPFHALSPRREAGLSAPF